MVKDKELEIELRFPVNTFNEIRKRLIEIGASFIEKREDHDIYLRHILDKDKRWILRIRNWSILTVKTGEEGKWREEEIKINIEKEKLLTFFEVLGFKKVLEIVKHRERWKFKEFEINLDDIKDLGKFVEIEGKSWEDIKKLAKNLGIKSKEIREGYVKLFERRRSQN